MEEEEDAYASRYCHPFAAFDTSLAECSIPQDKHTLLAIVEASFGDLNSFNKVMRGLFIEDDRTGIDTGTGTSRDQSSSPRSTSSTSSGAADLEGLAPERRPGITGRVSTV